VRWPGCFGRGEPGRRHRLKKPSGTDALATALAVGGDEVLAVVGGLDGYAGYLIRPDGSEAETGGFTFTS